MAKTDKLLAVIETIHKAGLDAQIWPSALGGITELVGGHIASIEAFEKPSLRHEEFLACGLPPLGQIEYLDHYASLNIRLPFHTAAKAGEVIWDYRILDEAEMKRSPFYAEFLPRIDCRYFVSGSITNSESGFAAVTVQRSPRLGHIDRAGIAMMKRLVPHVQQAFDVARRLKNTGSARHSLEQTLDWLADGAVLARSDGVILYANEAMQEIVRRNDGIKIKKGVIEFTAAEARKRFAGAMTSVRQLRDRNVDAATIADFSAARSSGVAPYLVAIRPLLGENSVAQIMIFVRDPLTRNPAALRALRQALNLTAAEAEVAQALQAGIGIDDYARARELSINTVYAHLRSIKQKTGCHRMGELTAKLNDLRMPVRTHFPRARG
jgi:DNA-binding CsgD family transcriptional regulator/PAS domain-containing protein